MNFKAGLYVLKNLKFISLWDRFSIWSAAKANIYLGCKSKRNSSILFLLLFPLILKVINFQWQLIISEEKSESIWLFVWLRPGKVFFNWKIFFLNFLCAFHSMFCTVFIIQDSHYNRDLSSNERISHREEIIILTKRH